MQADDFVMCDDCKEKTKDKKALKLHRVPEVLLIMLKRTMYPSTEKDDRHITFPLEASPCSQLPLPSPPGIWFTASYKAALLRAVRGPPGRLCWLQRRAAPEDHRCCLWLRRL